MTDRMAVVTGATGSLGSVIVRLLAERGIAVLAVSRSGERLGLGEAGCLAADVGSDDAIDEIRQALPRGELSMAVHSVGLPGSPGVTEVEPHMLAAACNIKAGGFLRLVRALDERISTGSRFVAIGGTLGIEPTEHAPTAGVANAALANLVRQLVGPLGRRGATVHHVSPGAFESRRMEALIAANAKRRGVDESVVRAEIVGDRPLGRLPTANDIAEVIVGLLEPAADALTGSTLFLDGGVRRGIH